MLSTSAYLIVFRIVHILASIAWGGSVFLFVLYVQPSAAAIGPAGAPFMRELVGARRLVDRLLMLATATIVGGLFLYWHDAGGFGGVADFASQRNGAVLTVGAISAIVAYLIGVFGTRPKGVRFMALAGQVAQATQAGGPPPPELAAEMQATQRTLTLLARLNLTFIAIAALAMATWRYW